ncbi:MAG: family 16 glycosylhydrolase [Arcanobacterium sp.]|nr:family 16 glycosylhydrolase [Arcanobacterium sp.]
MKLKMIAVILIVALAAAMGGAAAAGEQAAGEQNQSVPPVESVIDPASPHREGMILTASDEFNGADVNTLLFTNYYLPHWSTSPGTKARYEVSGGTLKLRIDEDSIAWDPDHDGSTRVSSLQTYQRDYLHKWTNYGSIARQTTPFRGHLQKYGYFEVRAKAARGGGLHSAWWMTGANQDLPDGDSGVSRQNGEFDIFEILGRNHASVAQAAIHPWGDWRHLFPRTSKISTGTDLSEDFHTYGFDWTPTGTKVFVDGTERFSSRMSPDYPMLMYLGIYEKREEKSWTGPFDSSIPYPKIFEVDYIRAYQYIPERGALIRSADGVMLGVTRADHGTTRWVGGEGNGVTLTNIYAPEDGYYSLAIEYRSGVPRDLQVRVNGDFFTLKNLSTGSFSSGFATAHVTVKLHAGMNSAHFGNTRGDAPDLGAVKVDLTSNI